MWFTCVTARLFIFLRLPTPPRGDAVEVVFGREQPNSTGGTFTHAQASFAGATCPARQPECLQSRPATRDCIERVQVHRERCRFKLATLEAVFSGKRPATLHAAKNIQTARDVRRDFKRRASAGVVLPAKRQTSSIRAPIFSTFAEWGGRGRDGAA